MNMLLYINKEEGTSLVSFKSNSLLFYFIILLFCTQKIKFILLFFILSAVTVNIYYIFVKDGKLLKDLYLIIGNNLYLVFLVIGLIQILSQYVSF